MTISAQIIDQTGTATSITSQGAYPAENALEVRIAVHADEVTLCRDGSDLLVDFEGGEQLRLEDFYGDGGKVPLFYLQAQDGSFIQHTVPEAQDACGAAGAAGGPLLAAAGLAGLAGIAAALIAADRNDGNGGNDNHAPAFGDGTTTGSVTEGSGGAPDGHKPVLKTDGEIEFLDKDKDDVHKVTTKLISVDGPTEEDKAVGRFTAEIVKDKDGSGHVEWHFEVDESEVEYLGEDQTLKQTYEIAVDDGHGGRTTKEVTVTVTGRNDVPEAKDITAEAKENVPVTITPDFTDKDRDDTHTFTVDTGKTKGHVTVNKDGTFTYDAGEAFDYLKEDETAYDTFTYTVRDQHGKEDTKTVTVKVVGQNDAPKAQDITAETTEDGPAIAIKPVYTDNDPDDTHTFKVNTDKTKGTVTVNKDGTFAYDPGNAFDYLGENETATDTFTYTVRDDHGGTDTRTVTVKISGKNDAPIANDMRGEVMENEKETVKPCAKDPDENDTLTLTVDASNAKGHVTANKDGTFTYDPGKAFDYLKEGETGSDSFTYTVRDQHGKEATKTITVDVIGQNDAPEAQDVALKTQPIENANFEDTKVFEGWHVDNSYEGRLSGPDKLANVKLSTPSDARGPAVQTGLSWDGWDKFANIQLRGRVDKFGTVWGPKLTSDPFSAKEGENLNVEWRWYRKNITSIDVKDVLHGKIILTNLDTGEKHTYSIFDTDGQKNYSFKIPETGRFTATYQFGMTDKSGDGKVDGEMYINNTTLSTEITGSDREYSFDKKQFLANTKDPEGDDVDIISVSQKSALGAHIYIGKDGQIHYDATGLDNLKAGKVYTDTFTFTVSDGHGGTDKATATVKVMGSGGGAHEASEPIARMSLDDLLDDLSALVDTDNSPRGPAADHQSSDRGLSDWGLADRAALNHNDDNAPHLLIA